MKIETKRLHTTLPVDTMEKIHILLEHYYLRYSNDLIKMLVDKEYNKIIKEEEEDANELS